MPGKSHRGRGRRSARSKKRQGTIAQPRAAAGTYETPAPAAPAPPLRVSAPVATPPQYSYVASELRRIGIVAGIMLAILVVLALLLP